jgi:exopolysaccharide production protein ExoZ
MEPVLKFSSIQGLRAFAANLVLLAHLSVIEIKYGHGVAVLPDWIGFGGAGVNLFFVISGFVMALVARDARWSNFIGARVIRIYPIYWFYTSLVLVVFLIRPEMVNQSFAHPPSILKSYLLWPEDVLPLLAVGWTLIHEMYFYIVMALIIAFAIPLRIALPVWALAVLAVSLLLNASSPAAAIVFHPMTLEFIAGAAIGWAILNGAVGGGRLCLMAGLALLIAGYVFYGRGPVITNDSWARVIYLGLPFIPIVYGVATMERQNQWPHLRGLSKLGDASYSTYLSHVLVVSVLGRVFVALPLHNMASEIIFLTACLVAANTVGALSFAYLERPSLRWLRGRFSVPVRTEVSI